MIITTTEGIYGKQITQTLGIARGSTVRARNVIQDTFAGLKNIVGERLVNILSCRRIQGSKLYKNDSRR